MKLFLRSLFAILSLLLINGSSLAQTTPSGSVASGLGFGGASAIMGDEIFVGSAPIGWPRGDELPGSVYVFKKGADGKWEENSRLQASDGQIGDAFGRSIAVSGDLLVIGAPGLQAAYVFKPSDAGQWEEVAKLMPTDMSEGHVFAGAMVRAANRSNAIATANGKVFISSFSDAEQNGAVSVFSEHGGEWHMADRLVPEDLEANAGFGWALAAADDHLFVGAFRADGGKGGIYQYTYSDSSDAWTASAMLTAGSLGGESALGQSLAVGNGKLFAGAPGHEGGVVVSFEFSERAGRWVESGQLTTFADRSNQRRMFGGGLGTHLAFNEGTLVTGSTRGVFTYTLGDDGVWTGVSPLMPADERSGEGFGFGLAAGANIAVVGAPRADYESGIASVFENVNGDWKHAGLLVSEVSRMESITGGQIDCEGGSAQAFDCQDVDLVSMLSVSDLAGNRGVQLTDIWGWTDPETGKEYVVQGRTDGTAFVDISDPTFPIYIGELMRTEGSPGSTWRDVKVYKNHAFIVADGAGEHGVQIFDLTQLRDVDVADMPVSFEMTAHYTGVHSTHNIVINEESGFAYAVGNRAGGTTCGGGLHAINVQDPRNPTFAGCYNDEVPGRSGPVSTHDSQCVNYRGPDTEHQGKEICFNSSSAVFSIADVSDKENMYALARTGYPNLAYTHQGWLTEDHKYFYMNDELDELQEKVEGTRTLIWDVQDLDDPVLVSEFYLDNRASDHNLYVHGNFLYQSNYQSGLRILDITDPLNPVETAHFDTVPFGVDEPGFGGSWSNFPYFKSGIIAVSSRGEGMFLVKKRDVDI